MPNQESGSSIRRAKMESGNGKCIDLVSSDDDVSSSDDEVVEVGVVEARRVSSSSKVKCRV